ncbi:MAG: hypothetical protein J6E32_08190, partial [Lachnospiraceae bacterium]|nr:hypothetical protein [Lachnospiraceae bacterium]
YGSLRCCATSALLGHSTLRARCARVLLASGKRIAPTKPEGETQRTRCARLSKLASASGLLTFTSYCNTVKCA